MASGSAFVGEDVVADRAAVPWRWRRPTSRGKSVGAVRGVDLGAGRRRAALRPARSSVSVSMKLAYSAPTSESVGASSMIVSDGDLGVVAQLVERAVGRAVRGDHVRCRATRR